jgi:hypothetical protein
MIKNEIIKALETLPGEIHALELAFYRELNKLRKFKNELGALESALYKEGKGRGSSDKVRTLQLAEHTKDENTKILRTEFLVDCAKAEMNRKKNELEAIQLIAKLMSN